MRRSGISFTPNYNWLRPRKCSKTLFFILGHANESLLILSVSSVCASSSAFWDIKVWTLWSKVFYLCCMRLICSQFPVTNKHGSTFPFSVLLTSTSGQLGAGPAAHQGGWNWWNCHKASHPLLFPRQQMTSQSVAELSISEIEKPVFGSLRLCSSAQGKKIWWVFLEKNEVYSIQFGLQKLTLLVVRGKIETHRIKVQRRGRQRQIYCRGKKGLAWPSPLQLLSASSCFLWYKSLLWLAAPEGKALFFTSSSGLGISLHFSRWPQQQQQTELILLPLTCPVIPSNPSNLVTTGYNCLRLGI